MACSDDIGRGALGRVSWAVHCQQKGEGWGNCRADSKMKESQLLYWGRKADATVHGVLLEESKTSQRQLRASSYSWQEMAEHVCMSQLTHHSLPRL